MRSRGVLDWPPTPTGANPDRLPNHVEAPAALVTGVCAWRQSCSGRNEEVATNVSLLSKLENKVSHRP